MRGMRITPRSINEIELETRDMRLTVEARDDNIIVLKIRAKDPHKIRTDTEVYTWDDKTQPVKNTEDIYIIPVEIKDD